MRRSGRDLVRGAPGSGWIERFEGREMPSARPFEPGAAKSGAAERRSGIYAGGGVRDG
jgi:hypothetical protein